MVLVPGLALSAAISELNSMHLVSGTARLTSAIMRFIGLAFGVALGTRVAQILFGIAPHVSAQPLPGWSDWLGVLIAPREFTVLMRARPVDAPAILGVCVLASLGGRTMRIARGRRSARNARAWSRRTRRSQVVACQQSGCQAHVMHSILLQIPMGAPLPSRQEAGSGSATEG